MKNIQIRKDFQDVVVGFNKTNLPLGKRSQEDLQELARQALVTKNRNLLRFFEELPALEELEAEKAKKVLAETKQLVEPKKENSPVTASDK